jgi:hypothetical protein
LHKSEAVFRRELYAGCDTAEIQITSEKLDGLCLIEL